MVSFKMDEIDALEQESPIRRKTYEFGLETIKVYRRMLDAREYVVSRQLLRSGTSIGANVVEASAAQSRNDFLKMCIASKEARETRYWLKLIQESQIVQIDVTKQLAHVDEILRILTSIVKTTSESR